MEDLVFEPNRGEILIRETAADLEIDRLLEAAAQRSGRDKLGNPRELTLEERLKIEILNTGQLTAPPLTIEDAFRLYTDKKKAGRVDRSAKAAVEQFIEHNGNVEIATIGSAQVMDWLDHLVNVRGQGYETVKKRLGALKAIVNFAKRRGAFDGHNPFVGHKAPDHARATLDRLPFHRVHLAAIDRYLAEGSVRDETRWIIALLKNTGCRPSEIGGLRAEDLSLDTEIPYALVRWSEDRRLKTNDSERRVPLIGEALVAARQALARRKTGWLFPSLAPTSGKLNDNQAISARINAVIRRAGIAPTPRLVCYSFRHTMAAALDQTPGLSHAVRERVLGRQRAQYGAREAPIQETHKALEQAIARLGDIDEVLYGPGLLEIGARDT
jgi:integrase